MGLDARIREPWNRLFCLPSKAFIAAVDLAKRRAIDLIEALDVKTIFTEALILFRWACAAASCRHRRNLRRCVCLSLLVGGASR